MENSVKAIQDSELSRRQLLIGGVSTALLSGFGYSLVDHLLDDPRPGNHGPVNPLENAFVAQFGIDTSRFQVDGPLNTGFVDGSKLRRQGIAFQIGKATRGLDTFATHKDPLYKDSRQQARDSQLLFGAYHFLNRGDGANQADCFLQFLEDNGGTDNLLCAVDVERYANDTIGPAYDDVLAFVDRFRSHISDRPLLLYTGRYWRLSPSAQGLGNPPAPVGTAIWYPQWLGTAKQPREGSPAELYPQVSKSGAADDPYRTSPIGGITDYTIRQFSARGHVAQFDGSLRRSGPAADSLETRRYVDINISFLTFDALKQYAGPAAMALPATSFVRPK